MFPHISQERYAEIRAFDAKAPALESITIDGKTFEVFHDYWHGRPSVTGGGIMRSVKYRVAGDPDSQFTHPEPPGGGKGPSWATIQPFTGRGAWRKYAVLYCWMADMEKRYAGYCDFGTAMWVGKACERAGIPVPAHLAAVAAQ